MAEKRDYYDILGVPRDADEKALKRAYRQLALKFHPDKNPDPTAADTFKEVSEAYAVLTDPEKRRRYDQFGHAGIDQRYSQEDIFRNVDFGDIFGEGGIGDLFSRIFGGGGGFGFGGPQRGPRQGRSIEHPLSISLEEAFEGMRTEVELRRLEPCATCKGSGSADGRRATCGTCGGQGQVQQVQRTPFGVMQRVGICPDCRGEGERIASPCRACNGDGRTPATRVLEVNVPAGVEDGMRLRLAREGEAGPRGGPPGDLLLTVRVQAHPRFERRGPDLFAELPVTFPRATLGGEVEFGTIDATVTVRIPAGTQNGKRLRLSGSGMPELRGPDRGDLYLTVRVITPTNLSERARFHMDALAEEIGDVPPPNKKKSFVDRVVDAFKAE